MTGATKGALAGIRVCDFTGQLAGAGATKWLAAFGAEVIRIEDPVRKGNWDILRGMPPYKDGMAGLEYGGAFNNHNVGKLGITLNMKTERGREMLAEIIRQSDCVTENFAAGVLERWGFSYERMRSIKPDIIYATNCGFGYSGPYREFKTWGPIVQAVSGLTFTSGLPDQPPAGWGYSYMDHTGAYYMAIAILLAIIHKKRTGEGQFVDLACTETALTLNGPAILDWTVNGRPSRRPGEPNSNRSAWGRMAPHGIYPCRGDDEWVAIACRDEADWARLARLEGGPFDSDSSPLPFRGGAGGGGSPPRDAGLGETHRPHPNPSPEGEGLERSFSPLAHMTLAERRADEDGLDATIAAWTAERGKYDVQAMLRAAGVPCSAVQKPEERTDHDPDTADLWPVVTHEAMGEVRVDGLPVRCSATPWHMATGAPFLGGDNEDVFGRLLGLSPAEVAKLAEEGVI